MPQHVSTCLWFNGPAKEAAEFYVSVFKNSKIVSIKRYPDMPLDEHMKGMEGKVLTGVFELNGQRFMALDGGPIFTFTEAVSLHVECESQEEVDYFWSRLSAVKESEQCGWCKDKFGLSWQIIPTRMGELLQDSDKEKAHKVANAMLQMHKLVIADLEKAYKS